MRRWLARWSWWINATCLLGLSIGFTVMSVTNAAQRARIESLRQKADRLDAHCRLMRGVVEGVRHDIDGTEAWKQRAAAYQWTSVASFDGRELAPCLHAGVAPRLMPCADGDPACVRLYSAMALASFESTSFKN